jgi:hypothetical protein
MFKPVKVPNFAEKLNSMYIASTLLNGGAFVDIDVNDTVAVTGAYGSSALRGGSLALATINASSAVPKEFGIALVDATSTGPSTLQRILRLATAYLQIPQGLNMAVYTPTPGDVFATSEYVGNLAADNGATGWIDITDTTKFGKECEVFQGRLRIRQSTNPVRYQYLGKTSTGVGATIAMFRCI